MMSYITKEMMVILLDEIIYAVEHGDTDNLRNVTYDLKQEIEDEKEEGE